MNASLASRSDLAHGTTGRVYLVGAGPGDPDLLTLRAARILAQADALVYDNLVSDGVLALANPAAQRIYAGKRRNEHTLRQEQINTLLVQLAREGRQVVRLKGGDPFIFGRGGEEMQKLAEAGIPFEVVPGVTAASGVACYAGIPLTHRDHAQSCLFVTGHLKNVQGAEAPPDAAPHAPQDGALGSAHGSARGPTQPDLDWAALARPQQTVVIYMGLSALPAICRKLIEHGAPPSRPIAAVQHATLATQRVITGTLADLPTRHGVQELRSPSLLIVGDVVTLHGTLDWFDPRSGAAMRLTHDDAQSQTPSPLPGVPS
ncbi:uroporphyrinogen-III C-methyltransferase [Hylemonella gracilis]|uniref:uroporphyrinogen-III C-methyltransferase n=1 Tax=Hylemonella gracilis ATCC 19624 TaxID=887062 RepID=F3KRR7_9BURK|nr:uroporphyrinogen-III C-methyltransferase [Hylemonella gracilis]EGI77518.1 uroporphyrin-III C-methyltransferase [Hylemonella gracilis ATCC 19624]